VFVARVEISGCIQEWTDLYEAIPRRHTNRAALLPQKPVPPEVIHLLGRMVEEEQDVKFFFFSAEGDRRRLVDISAAANRELNADPAVAGASERWLRLRWNEVQEHRDGLTIDAFGLPPLVAGAAKLLPSGMLRRLVADGARRGYSGLMSSAPLIGIIAVRDRLDREQCLLAGRIWQRAHLLATTQGLAGRPSNEAVEMIDHEQAQGKPAKRAGLFAELLGGPTWQPAFLFYLGYPTLAAHASPRRPVEQVLLTS
jgi:hypothetical protein